MRWFVPISFVIFFATFITLLSYDGDFQAKVYFVSIISISAFSIFSYALHLEKSRGKPITLKNLEKKVLYLKRGEGSYEIGSKKIIFLQKSGRPPLLAVILPTAIELPSIVSALYIVDKRDVLGDRVKGQGVIITCPPLNNTEKIEFLWKEAKKTKQENKEG